MADDYLYCEKPLRTKLKMMKESLINPFRKSDPKFNPLASLEEFLEYRVSPQISAKNIRCILTGLQGVLNRKGDEWQDLSKAVARERLKLVDPSVAATLAAVNCLAALSKGSAVTKYACAWIMAELIGPMKFCLWKEEFKCVMNALGDKPEDFYVLPEDERDIDHLYEEVQPRMW